MFFNCHSWRTGAPAAFLIAATLALLAPRTLHAASTDIVIINTSLPYACSYSDSLAVEGGFGQVKGRAKIFSALRVRQLRLIMTTTRLEISRLSKQIRTVRASADKRKLQRKLTLLKIKKSILNQGRHNCKRTVSPTVPPNATPTPSPRLTATPTPRPNCSALPVSINTPYEGKTVVGAINDSNEGQAYRWQINGTPAASHTTATTFLAHFNGSLNGANGETALTQNNISFEDSTFGQGMVGKGTYPMSQNFGLEEGTIELWMKLKQPLSHSVYSVGSGDPYIFRYAGPANESVMVNIKSDLGILVFTVYDGSGDWVNGAVQLPSSYNDIVANESVLLSMTFSKILNRSALFLNGFKIAQGDYHLPIVPSGNFSIGNNNIVIDEFRIFAEALPPAVIMDNYTRGRPFAANEVYLTGKRAAGDALELNFGECWDSKTVASPKIGLITDPGYVLANSTSFALDFATSEPSICAYDQAPGLFSGLGTAESLPTTQHHFEQAAPSTVPTYPVYIKCRAQGKDGDDYAFYRRFRVQPLYDYNFPKTANIFWGNAIDPSEVADLSRYDFVSVSKSSMRRSATLRALHEANPEMLLTFYIESNANPIKYGLTSFEHEDLQDRLLDAWRLRNVLDGSYAYNLYYPGVVMYNIIPEVPFVQNLVEHIEEDIMARGDWNGIFIDNTDSTFWQFYDYNSIPGRFVQYLDFDLDGLNEDLNIPADMAKAKNAWIRGFTNLFSQIRLTLGDAVVLNGNNADANSNQYNGKNWERFFKSNDPTRPPQNFFDMSNQNSFAYWSANTQAPQVNTNMFENAYQTNPGSAPAHYRYHRWGLAGSLLGGVSHVSVGGSDYRYMRWYDEYWVDPLSAQPTSNRSLGRGYLGQPLALPFEAQSGVWRRDFENGIVLSNMNASSATTPLSGTFRYIQGVQDPTANPGGLTSSVALQGYDGRILLRAPCSNNPSNDPRCINN